jgi:opacity protein-like surface antigen
MSRVTRIASSLVIVMLAWLGQGVASAQQAAEPFAVRGFADFGAIAFSASDSFEAVFGSRTGTVFGGGGEVVLPQRIFVGVRASRVEKTGERVFVFDDEVFPLGIETTVRVTPIEITGGYRFGGIGSRVIPYVGGGLGWHRYEESSEFAEDDENVKETHHGYHLLGGAELRLARWFGVGGEVQWTTVPDGLSGDPNSVAAAFEETDLGGVAFRVKFVIGQ